MREKAVLAAAVGPRPGCPKARHSDILHCPTPFRFLGNGLPVPHEDEDVYFEEPRGPATRLAIGPSTNHVELLTGLSAVPRGRPWFALYVLLVPRQGNRPAGRYPSAPFDSGAALSSFLAAFRAGCDWSAGKTRGRASDDSRPPCVCHPPSRRHLLALPSSDRLSAASLSRSSKNEPCPRSSSPQSQNGDPGRSRSPWPCPRGRSNRSDTN